METTIKKLYESIKKRRIIPLFALLLLLSTNSQAYATKVKESAVLFTDYTDDLVLADAPWRIEPGEMIPLYLMIKGAKGDLAHNLTNVYVYDLNNNHNSVKIYDKNGNQIGNNLGGELPKLIDQELWTRIVYVKTNELTLKTFLDIYNLSVVLQGEHPFKPDILGLPWNLTLPIPHNVEDTLVVSFKNVSLPSLGGNWFCGDGHYHTSYSDNFVEVGATVNATIIAGKAQGLDWVALTDHSFDFDSENERSKWAQILQECKNQNSLNPDFKCLNSEEISTLNSKQRFVHLLAYSLENSSEAIIGEERPLWYSILLKTEDYTGISPEKNLDSNGDGIYDTAYAYNLSNLIQVVDSRGGFSYFAHPFDVEKGVLRQTLDLIKNPGGTIYNLVNNDVLVRGVYQPTDYNLLGYRGLEIWNGIQDEDIERLSVGVSIWSKILRQNITSSRRIYVDAGTDAHGDFNYRRYWDGNALAFKGPTAGSTAYGKTRTCCFMPSLSVDNVYGALRSGRCFMTDGPALSFTVNNVSLGETVSVGSGDAVNLTLFWNSSPEFGQIQDIVVYKGLNASEEGNGVYHTGLVALEGGVKTLDNASKKPWLQINEPCYFRAEARTVDGKRAITNPIWVNVTPKAKLVFEGIDVVSEAGGSAGGEGVSDGNFNFGEKTSFNIHVKNTGQALAENVKAQITLPSHGCDNDYSIGWKTLGDIPAGEEDIAYDFYVDLDRRPGCDSDKGGVLDLNLSITHDWDSSTTRVFPLKFVVNPDFGGPEVTDWEADLNPPGAVFWADISGEELLNNSVFVYYRCGNTEISDADFDGSMKMKKTCATPCGPHEYKANFSNIVESCEGKQLYYRFKITSPDTIFWSPAEPYEGGVFSDDDTIPPNASIIPHSGPANPEALQAFEVSLSDAKGVLDSDYYPLIYYKWNDSRVDGDNYDGVLDLNWNGSRYTASLNLSEFHEGETLFYRVYAGDNDNTPSYGWSSVQTGSTVNMKPPSTPVILDATYSKDGKYTLDWSDSLDGSGVRDYELKEVKAGGLVSVETVNASKKDYVDSEVLYLSVPPNYSVRARDNKGNWGNWSEQTPVQFPDLTLHSTDIKFNNSNPRVGETVLIEATIRNTGLGNPYGFPVDFYDGHPCYGVKLGSANATSTPAGGNTTVRFAWTPQSPGNHSINVMADGSLCCGVCPLELGLTWGEYWEKNEDNNLAEKTIEVKNTPSCRGSSPPQAGVWSINSNTNCNNCTINLGGSILTFTSDATLTIENTTVKFP